MENFHQGSFVVVECVEKPSFVSFFRLDVALWYHQREACVMNSVSLVSSDDFHEVEIWSHYWLVLYQRLWPQCVGRLQLQWMT